MKRPSAVDIRRMSTAPSLTRTRLTQEMRIEQDRDESKADVSYWRDLGLIASRREPIKRKRYESLTAASREVSPDLRPGLSRFVRRPWRRRR